MYKVLLPVRTLEETHENSLRRETLFLPPVWPDFLSVWSPEESQDDTQWRDSLLLLRVHKVLLPVNHIEDSHENPHRGETLFLPPV